MIGIRFEIPNEFGYHLKHIVSVLNFTSNDWFIEDAEVYNQVYENYFKKGVYSQDKLLELCDQEHYLIMLDLRIFPKGSHCIPVQTVQEFKVSDCQLVLLCCDSSFIDIYCKDHNIQKAILEMCKYNGYKNLERIEEKTDTRTRLSVW